MSRLCISFTALLLTLLCVSSLWSASAQERTWEVYVCKVRGCLGDRMPLAVTEVRNFHKEQWWRDLEVEVKNVSAKPIYFIRFFVLLPDTTDSPSGLGGWGAALYYGRRELINIKLRAESEDVPLKPGESHVFRIAEDQHGTFTRLPEALTRRALLRIDTINFGDGTGVEAGGVLVSRSRR